MPVPPLRRHRHACDRIPISLPPVTPALTVSTWCNASASVTLEDLEGQGHAAVRLPDALPVLRVPGYPLVKIHRLSGTATTPLRSACLAEFEATFPVGVNAHEDGNNAHEDGNNAPVTMRRLGCGDT